MAKHVFLSYIHEDEESVLKVERWAKEGRLGKIEPVRMKKDRRQEGDDVVKSKLRGMVNSVHAAVILVGDDTHDRPWIEYEVNVILSAQKPVVVVRIPETTGAPPPQLRKYKEVAFEPEAIKTALKAVL